MAEATNSTFRISKDSQSSLIEYCKLVLEQHKKMQDYRDKMEMIDCKYALYNCERNTPESENGVDRYNVANQPVGINLNDVTVPIVVSQVDTYVGYWADIYLTGFPMFPVVSTFANRQAAEALEAIIDDHAVRGRYAMHMLMNFLNAAKYNIGCMELDWSPLNIYNVADALAQIQSTGRGKNARLAAAQYMYNALTATDMYNTIWDYRKDPVDVPYCGEYAGTISLMSYVELKQKLLYYGASGDGYNTSQALNSRFGTASALGTFEYYTEKPDIQNLINNKELYKNGFDWERYLEGKRQGSRSARTQTGMYEHLKLYIRIIPKDHGMSNIPDSGTPQVWKVCYVNHEKLVYARRQYTLYDMIPMFFTQPFNDGFGMQTKGIGERGIPFQEAASTLMSIRFNSARRAVSDRAIYDPGMINSSDVNAPFPAPKIPIRDGKTLSGKKLEDAYKQIPFDSRGTETVIADMAQVVSMADKMAGINQANQGQHVKGNKTRAQWEDTQEGAQNRMRLPTIAIEYHQILPVKEQIVLNIYQYGVEGSFQSYTSGTTYEIDNKVLQEIRAKVNKFKVGDGFHPSEKLASSDVLLGGFNMIGNSPILSATLGKMLPNIWIQLMSQGGVRGLEEFLPEIAKPENAVPVEGGPPAPTATPAPAQPAPAQGAT